MQERRLSHKSDEEVWYTYCTFQSKDYRDHVKESLLKNAVKISSLDSYMLLLFINTVVFFVDFYCISLMTGPMQSAGRIDPIRTVLSPIGISALQPTR